jgi:hypothetical protein
MVTTLVSTALVASRNGTLPVAVAVPAEGDLSAMVMDISPQMAAQLLTHRLQNRPLNRGHVRRLAQVIRAGQWRCNGESLVLTEHMQVIDGQHRLAAIRDAGVTVRCLVVVGADPQAMSTIDTGRARSVSDTLATYGLKSTKTLAGVCAWLYRFETNRMCQGHVRLPNGDVLAFVEQHKGLESALPWAKRLKGLLPGSLAAGFNWLMTQRDAGLAERFFQGLATGLQLDAESPIHTVRQRLIRDRHVRPSHREIVSQAALLVLGFNCLRRGHRMPYGMTWRGVQDDSVGFPSLL